MHPRCLIRIRICRIHHTRLVAGKVDPKSPPGPVRSQIDNWPSRAVEEDSKERKSGITDLIVTDGVGVGRASVVVRRASVVVRRASGREGFEVLSQEE